MKKQMMVERAIITETTAEFELESHDMTGEISLMINGLYVLTFNNNGTVTRTGCADGCGFKTDADGKLIVED